MVLGEMSLLLLVFSSEVQETDQLTVQTPHATEPFLTLCPLKIYRLASYLVNGSGKHPQIWYVFSSNYQRFTGLVQRNTSLKTSTVQ